LLREKIIIPLLIYCFWAPSKQPRQSGLQLLIAANAEGTNETRVPEACACKHLPSDIVFGSFWNSHTGFQYSLPTLASKIHLQAAARI
jgi:hypothetical protein